MTYDAELKLFIDGTWRSGEGRDTHNVINPASGSGIADVPLATKADLDEALAAAERAWPVWRATDVEKRAAILHKTAALLVERAGEGAGAAGGFLGRLGDDRTARGERGSRFLCEQV